MVSYPCVVRVCAFFLRSNVWTFFSFPSYLFCASIFHSAPLIPNQRTYIQGCFQREATALDDAIAAHRLQLQTISA